MKQRDSQKRIMTKKRKLEWSCSITLSGKLHTNLEPSLGRKAEAPSCWTTQVIVEEPQNILFIKRPYWVWLL